MLNCLLVMPRSVMKKGEGYIFPLGIAYVSSSMKKEKDFHVINLNLNHTDEAIETIIKQYIEKYAIDVVLTGGLSIQFIALKQIVACVKKLNPQIITILSVEPVKGIIYQKDEQYFMTEAREENTNLDQLEMPDYEGFEFSKLMDIEVNSSGAYNKRSGSIIASRSCPFQCTFCFHPSGKKYRQRSLENVFKEIDLLCSRYDLRFLSIADELFSYDINRLREFCRRIIPYKINWSAQFRISDVTEEMITLLKEANCTVISYGIESADNNILASMRKHINRKSA